jgi:hypothetical protein
LKNKILSRAIQICSWLRRLLNRFEYTSFWGSYAPAFYKSEEFSNSDKTDWIRLFQRYWLHPSKCRQKLDKILILQQKIMLTMIKCTIFLHFSRGAPKDHSTKVWLQLAQWFLRRRLKCEMLTDGRRTKSDGNSSHGLKARIFLIYFRCNIHMGIICILGKNHQNWKFYGKL